MIGISAYIIRNVHVRVQSVGIVSICLFSKLHVNFLCILLITAIFSITKFPS